MDEELRNIEKELESIVGKKRRGKKNKNLKFSENNSFENLFEKFSDNTNLYYLIPIIIFIILIVIKPNFLYDNDIEKREKVFSFTKLFLFTLIFSIILISIFYL